MANTKVVRFLSVNCELFMILSRPGLYPSIKRQRQRNTHLQVGSSLILIHSYLINQQPALNCIIYHNPLIVPHFLLHCLTHTTSRSLINNSSSLNRILNNYPKTYLNIPKTNRSIPENMAHFLYSCFWYSAAAHGT